MKIDRAWHFAGEPSLPPAFRGPGPHELTFEQLAELMKDHAVLLYRSANGETVIAFDSHRGRFKQR